MCQVTISRRRVRISCITGIARRTQNIGADGYRGRDLPAPVAARWGEGAGGDRAAGTERSLGG